MNYDLVIFVALLLSVGYALNEMVRKLIEHRAIMSAHAEKARKLFESSHSLLWSSIYHLLGQELQDN